MPSARALLLLAGALAPAVACVVPQIVFQDLPQPFDIDVLYPPTTDPVAQPFGPLDLIVDPPTAEEEGEPVIGKKGFARPAFKFVNGTLVAYGFPARQQPGIKPFPPPLLGFDFGGPGDSEPLQFIARYGCDGEGKQTLFLQPTADSGNAGFAVESTSEGSKVFLRPNAYEGQATDVTLRINQ